MKKIHTIFVLVIIFGLQQSYADAIHCAATYLGKPFVQATIWSGIDGFGPAECDYKAEGDTELTVFSFPSENQYYVVTGEWRSTMPGYQWCDVQDGNTYDSCRFALRVTSLH